MAGEFSTVFTGSATDYFLRNSDLTGNANGKNFLISVWFYITSTVGTKYVYDSTGNASALFFTAAEKPTVFFENAANANIVNLVSDIQSLNTWHHFASSGRTDVGHLTYIDGVAVTPTETVFVDDTIDFTETRWAVGSNSLGNFRFPGYLSELYFTNEFLDISVAANLAKLIFNGKPVYLGADGSLPTGTAPLIYLPDANGADNKGSGGNLVNQGSQVRLRGPGAKPSSAVQIHRALN